jgi:YegS/Rv2252/BmrU family lipid kinase
MTRRVSIIFNPKAGLAKAHQRVEWTAEVLREHGWDATVRPTQRPGQMSELTALAVAEGADAVFAAGGDGTVGAVAEVLGGSDVILGVLPLGTANIWAADLGVPLIFNSKKDVRACVDAQLNGRIRRVDMGRTHDRKFLLWSGVGLDAHVVGKVEPRPEIGKRFGVVFYFISGLIAATSFKGGPMTVRTESKTISGTKMMVLICNIGRYAGSDSILDRESRPDDGIFEIWTLEGKNMLDGLKHLILYKMGRHNTHPTIQRIRASRIEIETPNTMPIHFDGEKHGDITQTIIEMLPNHLNVFAPIKQ